MDIENINIHSLPLSKLPECGRISRRVTPEQGQIARQMARFWAKIAQSRARAKKYGVENTLTWKQWKPILEKSCGVCHYCKKFVGLENIGIDHVIPLTKGGSNSIKNVVACCLNCNCRKNDKLPNEFLIDY